MRKWTPHLIIAIALIASVAAYPRLPETMVTHWGSDGPNGWSPKLLGAFVVPLILVFVAVLMRVLPLIDPRRVNYPKFAGGFEAMFISNMLLLLFMHLALLAAGLGYPVAMDRIAPIGVGALMIALGNLMPRARPNWFIGVRTPWTLSSDRVWEKTNRLAGYVLVITGAIMLLLGFASARFSMYVMAPLIGAEALSLVVYSYVEWRREAKGSATPSA